MIQPKGWVQLANDPSVSVIVCTYNRGELLLNALDTLINQETDGEFCYEIIVVDNGSTGGTENSVNQVGKRAISPIKYVVEHNPGIAHARNRGVKESTGEWVAIFDDDQTADPYWLKELISVASIKGADCVGGRRILPFSESELSNIGVQCRRMLGETQLGQDPVRFTGKEYPCDANVIRHRRVHATVGLFDTSMTCGGQDQDFSRRAASKGFKMWYAPKAVVYHWVPKHVLTAEYFRWHSLRSGVNYAYQDRKQWGLLKTLLACVARIGQATLVNLPVLLSAVVQRDYTEMLDRKYLIWRTVGYIRGLLFVTVPKIFPQKKLFSHLNFRTRRSTFPEIRDSTNVRRSQ
jgi:GT2 family glycosyltransferase